MLVILKADSYSELQIDAEGRVLQKLGSTFTIFILDTNLVKDIKRHNTEDTQHNTA